ncbi:hypothetical protein A2U01_0000949 [Trifolium medium]|uniref:Putative plant transposon protein domain-containing protein n=1 Tax=Trifolium medium TaxID=97028 RepID=A0A392LZ11_9FABA|nr:hypothetical protein [Trifolium medium]
MGRGKSKAAAPAPSEKPPKKSKSTKGAKSKLGAGGTSQQTQSRAQIPQERPIPLKQRFATEAAFARTTVRGKSILWTPHELNKFLGTQSFQNCALSQAREESKSESAEKRSEIKDFVCLPGTPWLKCRRNQNPTRMQLTRFKPVARAWAEFFVKSVEGCSNSSEIQVNNAKAVKMILEGVDFDLGETLYSSLYDIANNKDKNNFTLGHCNLISALCRAREVPEYRGDEPFFSVKSLTPAQFRGYDKDAVIPPPDHVVHSEDEMSQFEDGVHPLQQPLQVPTHSEDEIAAVATQLAIAEACNIPHTFYSEESTLYQAAKTRQVAIQPPPLYPRYRTRESLKAYQAFEMAQLAARHAQQLDRWEQEHGAYQQRDHFTEADLGLDDTQIPMDPGGSSLS